MTSLTFFNSKHIGTGPAITRENLNLFIFDDDEEGHLLYAHIMAHSRGKPNDEALACMLVSWGCNTGVLPGWMGLAEDAFHMMLDMHFPGLAISIPSNPTRSLDPVRQQERNDLRELLLNNRAGQSDSEVWIADIVSAACMGQDHLWQDLGLRSRQQLSDLITINFPQLAACNDREMKWKKFLYKQLCNAEGIYICRSPSCEVCVDYALCFGPEE